MDNFSELFKNQIAKAIKTFLINDFTEGFICDFLSGLKFKWETDILEYSRMFNSDINVLKIDFVSVNCLKSNVILPDNFTFLVMNVYSAFSVTYCLDNGDKLTEICSCNVSLEGNYFLKDKSLRIYNLKPVHFQPEDEPSCTDPSWMDFKTRYCREDALLVDLCDKFELPLASDLIESWKKERKLPNISQEKKEKYDFFYQQKNTIAEMMFCKKHTAYNME